MSEDLNQIYCGRSVDMNTRLWQDDTVKSSGAEKLDRFHASWKFALTPEDLTEPSLLF